MSHSHSVKIIDYKKLNDGQIAVAAQCCCDPVHTSWHTMAAAIVLDQAAFQSDIDWHINRVAQQHETALQAEAVMPELIGKAFKIDPMANQQTAKPAAVTA